MTRSHVQVLLTTGIVSLTTFAGCTVGPNYEPPHVTVLDNFGEQGREPTTRPDDPAAIVSKPLSGRPPVVAWWTTFHDETLDDLIARAADQNLNLKMAESRVREARALRSQAVSGLFPLLNTNVQYQHVRPSENGVISAFGGGGGGSTAGSGGTSSGSTGSNGSSGSGSSSGSGGGSGVSVGGSGANAPGANGSSASPASSLGELDLYQLGFDASYELDIWGRARRGVEAADASVQAAVEDQRDTLLTLLGEVAREYVDLRSMQNRLRIAKANLEAQSKIRDLTNELVSRGLTTQLDLSRADAQVATTAASIPTLEAAIGQSIHRLSLLLAERPTALAEQLSTPQLTPGVPDEVPIGLPSELLRRRPDVRRAERQLAAATASIGVATADLFPRFALNGSVGLQSLQPGDLGSWASRYFSFGPSISYPLFDAGRRRAQVTIAAARREQEVYRFQQTVLTALGDVEDALIRYQTIQQRTAQLRIAVAANQQSLRIAQETYQQGIEDFTTVLDAERSLFSAEDQLASAEGERATTLIALYKSLGGGWEMREPVDVYGPNAPRPVVTPGNEQPSGLIIQTVKPRLQTRDNAND